jgi:hypothetical protein
MKQMSLTTVAIAASTFACAALLSFGWSEQRGLSLSVEKAEARVGRPLTPVSVAGVARRQNRRAAYGAGVVGAGAAAVGTAAAVAATSPNWGWGGYYGNPNGTPGGPTSLSGTGSSQYGGSSPGAPDNPYRTGTGYYAGGPYYGGSVRGARAAYYGGYPSAAWGGMSSGDRDLYIRNLHDSGYDQKNNFNASGNLATQ